MKTLGGAALKAHYALGTTTLATCWKATLTNGNVVAATSHDRDILFGGVTYESVAAYTPSDIESGSKLAPDNLELEGFLASPHITDADIHSGLWDFAAIEIFEVNYKDLTMGRNRLRDGTLGEVEGGRAQFRAELRGLTQAYSRTIVRLIQKECPWDLGDASCTVDLEAFTVTGTVTTVSENRDLTDSGRTEALNWFTGGKLTFISGENSELGAAGANLSMEVKYSAGTSIKLHEMMPFTIAVGDTYTLYAGCAKRFEEDCVEKFDNGLHFGGYPHLPGSRIYAGPNS